MLNFSDNLNKTKTKLLIFSGVSLFIAISKSLPQKVAVLGMDLSKNETIVGWFVFAITVYFLFNFLVYSLVELTQYFLPSLIGRKTRNTTGSTLGLTAEECFTYEQNQSDCSDIGTESGELSDINRKNEEITFKYKNGFVQFSNAIKLAIEFVFPLLFSFISSCFLYSYLVNVE